MVQQRDVLVEFLAGLVKGEQWRTREFELTARSRRLRVDAVDAPLIFSARRHHDIDIERATTTAELDSASTVEVHVDTAMRGLGTAACGPDALPPFHLRDRVYNWSWALRTDR